LHLFIVIFFFLQFWISGLWNRSIDL
jgi:hypothetical protein